MKTLTDKQEMFCREYLVDLNATQAAIRAGYSVKTARKQACVMVTKGNIQNRLQGLIEKRNETTDLTSEMVISRLREKAFSDDVTDSNQIKALDLLMRHLGAYNDHSSVSVETKPKTLDEMTDEELIALAPEREL